MSQHPEFSFSIWPIHIGSKMETEFEKKSVTYTVLGWLGQVRIDVIVWLEGRRLRQVVVRQIQSNATGRRSSTAVHHCATILLLMLSAFH